MEQILLKVPVSLTLQWMLAVHELRNQPLNSGFVGEGRYQLEQKFARHLLKCYLFFTLENLKGDIHKLQVVKIKQT